MPEKLNDPQYTAFRLPVALAIAFLTLDVLFIGLNVLWRTLELTDIWPPRPALIQISNDYGLPKILNFAKCLVTADLLTGFTPTHQRRIWLPIALVFIALFIDDAFQLHETAGTLIGDAYVSFADTRKSSSTIGEVVYAIGLGLAVYGTLLVSWRQAEEPAAIAVKKFFILLVALGFFGVVVDFMNSFIVERFGNLTLDAFGSMIEHGGEMIIFSLCVWTANAAISSYKGHANT